MAKKKNIKKLFRSKEKEAMVGGVCAGLAEYFNVDPTIIRLVWALITVFTWFFPGIIAYLIMWVIMPKR